MAVGTSPTMSLNADAAHQAYMASFLAPDANLKSAVCCTTKNWHQEHKAAAGSFNQTLRKGIKPAVVAAADHRPGPATSHVQALHH